MTVWKDLTPSTSSMASSMGMVTLVSTSRAAAPGKAAFTTIMGMLTLGMPSRGVRVAVA